jgi:hypothetical protein
VLDIITAVNGFIEANEEQITVLLTQKRNGPDTGHQNEMGLLNNVNAGREVLMSVEWSHLLSESTPSSAPDVKFGKTLVSIIL